MSALFDQTRSILLLRDPRDELLSIRAFNDKRGTLAFGWRSDDTDRSFAERHIDARRAFLREFAAAKGDERLFKLRYEDLMREGRAVAEALGAWLGVELSWEPVTGSVAEFAHHVTSATPEESVERWRRELSPEVAELFRRRLGDELRAVGYEL